MRRLIIMTLVAAIGTGFWLVIHEKSTEKQADRNTVPEFEQQAGKAERPVLPDKDIDDSPGSGPKTLKNIAPNYLIEWPKPELEVATPEPFIPMEKWAKTPNFREVKNIVPPIAGVNPPASATLVGEKLIENGGIVNLGFHAFLHIPAASLIDENGNPIEEPVKISYCPLSDPVDVYLSGVPMSYDSAGEVHSFRTAGMVRLEAETYSGKKVSLKEGQTMRLDMPTVDDEDTYNFYTFNEERGGWSYSRPSPPSRPAIDLVIDTLDINYPFDITPFKEKFSNMRYHYLTSSQVKKKKHKLRSGRIVTSAMERSMREALYASRFTSTNLIKLNPSNPIIAYTEDHKPIREVQFKITFAGKGGLYFRELRHFRGFHFVAEDVKSLQDFYKHFRRDRKFHDIRLEYEKGEDYCTLVLKDEKEMVRIKARISRGAGAGFTDISKFRFVVAYLRYSRDLKQKETLHDEIIQKEKRLVAQNSVARGLLGFYNEGSYRQLNLPGFSTFNCDQIARMIDPLPVASRFLREDGSDIYPEQFMVCDKRVRATFSFYGTASGMCSDGGFSFALVNSKGKTYYLPAKEKQAAPDKQVFVLKELPDIEDGNQLRSLLFGN